MVTKEHVKEQLLMLNIFKSAKMDNLHPRVLKELANELSEPLMLIINISCNTEEVPEVLKKS